MASRGLGARSSSDFEAGLNARARERVPQDVVLLDKSKEVPMAENKIDLEHEVGGFNPERRDEKSKSQVGPAPTDDPRNKATPDLKSKIDKKRTQVAPD
jgi:hypothetical protein